MSGRYGIAAVAVLACGVLARVAHGGDGSERVGVTAVANKKTYRQLEPIRITVTATNRGRMPVYYESSHSPCNRFDVQIRRLVANGKTIDVPRTYYYQSMKAIVTSLGSRPIGSGAPGAVATETFTANLFSDMTDTDRYSITVEVSFWDEEPEPRILPNDKKPLRTYKVRSEPVIVEVVGE